MFKAFEFCLPTNGKKVPSGPEWFHEIKQDGFRIRVERDCDRVRLVTRGGYNWTDRYPRTWHLDLRSRHGSSTLACRSRLWRVPRGAWCALRGDGQERNVVMEGIAPLGTLDPQHVIAQLAKALADPARAFASPSPRDASGSQRAKGRSRRFDTVFPGRR